MPHYQEFLDELKSYADEEYRTFHKRLLKNDEIEVLGVRVPVLRKLAKKYKIYIADFMAFPDDFYEVTFVKLTIISLLPYESFVKYVNECVAIIDNWATCDCFAPKCISKNKDEFLPFIYTYLNEGKEFYQRFALTTLLHFYVEEKYYQSILSILRDKIDTGYYYVHMAAAWLLAELMIKFYDDTAEFLKENVSVDFLDKKTHNKAIQKACESYRLTENQKNYLKGLKR